MIVLFFYGLIAWGDDSSSQIPNLTTNTNSTPPTPAAALTSNNNSTSTVAIKDVPVNNVPTPINITINNPPSKAPEPEAEPKHLASPPPESHPPTAPPPSPTMPPSTSLDIVINKEYLNSPKIHKLYKLLGITGKPKVIHLVTNRHKINKNKGIIGINTRSFVSVLDFLSNAVEVYQSIYKQKLVVSPQLPDGTYFNLNLLTKGLLTIHISNKRPQSNVNIAVVYRNYWFYIADTDYKSKRTLSMIEQVFNLQAGETTGQAIPVLTIPTR